MALSGSSKVMAKRTPQLSSSEARRDFMAKISEGLPFLGFLNDDDKGEVWKFWKTVSSAVKIAVNGKGDIVETPRRNSKSSKSAREREMEEYRLQQLDRNAITIYVPVKCPDKGYRRYRVLKLANHKKVADYLETIPGEDGDSSTELLVTEKDLECINLSQLTDSDIQTDNPREVVVEQLTTSQSDVNQTDQDLQSVAEYIKSEQNDYGQQETVVSINLEQESENTQSTVKVDTPKPAKRVWPVGRPTTRSSTGARVIKTNKSLDDNSMTASTASKISKLSFPKNEISNADSALGEDCITFYPDVKQEAAGDDVADDFNITIVPVGNNVMQISHTTNSSQDETVQGSQANTNQHAVSQSLDISEQLFSQTSLPHGQSTSQYSVHVSLPTVNDSDRLTLDGSSVENTEQQIIGQVISIDSSGTVSTTTDEVSGQPTVTDSTDQTSGGNKQDSSHSHLTPRNASDIETIISALEEELKKTGTSIATVSVSSSAIQSSVKGVPPAVSEVSIGDDQTHYPTSTTQTVQILDGQEIVEVQHVENVIFTSDGHVQIVDGHQVLEGTAAEGTVVQGDQQAEAHYDVVEYEVLADGKQKRGRKRKFREGSTGAKSDVVDRTCPMCHRVLNYASSMAAHMRTHTGVRPYSCGQCDRRFTTKANRDRHEATHVGLKPFKCTQCNKAFTEKRSLTIHMRTHTGERPFACETCGQRFTQKCTLIVHMDRHTNKKGHLCDLCGKAFRQKCQLDVHVKRHNQQALYPCTECTVRCYTRGDLVRHMIKHTGERPFRCKLCPRAFTRKQYLVDHENQHYNRKPYMCSVCTASFHDMGSCHRHIRKHKMEEEGERDPFANGLLVSGDFHKILECTQIGKILKLGDGSDAVVKNVTSESDGSTVYHITCLNTGNDKIKTELVPEDSNTSEISQELPVDGQDGTIENGDK